MKYKAIDTFKNVQNVPYRKTTSDMKVGMGVILDYVAKTATLPASENDVKKIVYTVISINDKPELHSSPEIYVVNEGEYVRADDLRTVSGFEAEFTAFEINGGTTGLAAEDLLVFGTDSKIARAASADGYTVYFKIIRETPYMDDGILTEVVVQ